MKATPYARGIAVEDLAAIISFFDTRQSAKYYYMDSFRLKLPYLAPQVLHICGIDSIKTY